MMLSRLTDIAATFGLTFLFGEKEAFNILADSTDPDIIVMYHEGYVSGQKAEDAQGAWETSYSLRIWLLIKNTGANDGPIDRRPRFDQLEPLMDQILSNLSHDYVIGQPVTLTEGINQVDKSLDGIRFVATAKPKAAPTVYC